VAQNTPLRHVALSRHCVYEVSQQKRLRSQTIGELARSMLCGGVKKLDFKLTLKMAAYDLTKLPRLISVTPE
jgi:hypothetical protein